MQVQKSSIAPPSQPRYHGSCLLTLRRRWGSTCLHLTLMGQEEKEGEEEVVVYEVVKESEVICLDKLNSDSRAKHLLGAVTLLDRLLGTLRHNKPHCVGHISDGMVNCLRGSSHRLLWLLW